VPAGTLENVQKKPPVAVLVVLTLYQVFKIAGLTSTVPIDVPPVPVHPEPEIPALPQVWLQLFVAKNKATQKSGMLLKIAIGRLWFKIELGFMALSF
jgi:hypothetical protein